MPRDTLFVPVQAVFSHRGQTLCFVSGPAGPERREGDVGRFNKSWSQILDGLTEGELVLLAGASGSGKSSVTHAGLIPALAKGAIEGSDRWLVASMVPGGHPFAELDAALLRTTIDAPASLGEQLRDGSDAPDVLDSVLGRKTEVAVEPVSDVVAVENKRGTSLLMEQMIHAIRDGALAAAGGPEHDYQLALEELEAAVGHRFHDRALLEARIREVELLEIRVLEELAAIQETAGALAVIDVMQSFAETARLFNYCRPDLDASLVQPVEDFPLVVERVLGAVEILRGRLVLLLHRRGWRQRAAAEGNDAAVNVGHGKHQPMSKPIIVTAAGTTGHDESDAFGVRGRCPRTLEEATK